MAFIFHMCISCGKTFLLETKIFYPVTLTLTFDLLLKKLNLDHNFEPHIYSLWQDLSVDTNIFDLVALTLTLTYFWKYWNWLLPGVLVLLGQTPF